MDTKIFPSGPRCPEPEGLGHRQGLAAALWPLQNEGLERDTARPRRVCDIQRAPTSLRAGVGPAKVEGKSFRPDLAEPEKWVNLQTRVLVRF